MKKILSLLILTLLPMLASAQTVLDVQNSGCLSKTRGEEPQRESTMILTKEGTTLSVQLLNYESNCATQDFNVSSSINGEGGIYGVSVDINPVLPEEATWCLCPFNISFTIHDLEPNSFYFNCWWYKGQVELTEGEPMVMAYKTDVKINEENFPDENFRKYLLGQEYGEDGVLTEDEIARVTFVNLLAQNIIAKGNIHSLKGIEYFTAMTKLICSRNELTELDLSKNTALTWLECYGNHLTELNLSKNTELTYLDCQSNELTALNVSGCTKLTELNCFGNQLTKLNVSGCSALTILKCYLNLLMELDVSGCTSLTTMWVFDNQLPVLDVSDCNSLSDLRCDNNQLTQLDVSKNTMLAELRCEDNLLTALNLSKNKNLNSLRTYHNPIKGEAMDVLIESLPTVSNGGWCVVLSKNEEDVVTTTQVAAAKAKGWTSYYWNEAAKSWMEYAGSTHKDDYRPLVEDGKVWKVGNTQTISDNVVNVVDYYYFDGDTIIDGKTCKQMMCQRFVNPDYTNEYSTPKPSLTKVGAWYEENQKVYYYDERKQSMVIKYDFSLGANDTLRFITNGSSPFIIGPKQTGGIEGYKGVYRDIRMCGDKGQSYHDTFWLEGIGCVRGPLSSPCDPILADPTPEFLMSCTVGDEVIYLDDSYEDAATPKEMGARKQRFDFTHTIKTKPKAPMRRGDEMALYGEYSQQQLAIHLNPLDDAYLVRITDETGKDVYQKAINAGSIVGLNIDISAYEKGRYTVTVENSNESFTGEFEAQTTGIEAIKANKEDVRNDIYNLHGQRLSTLQKGLNIINGQKVFVK
jgi:hypothetical protein